ncbi:MAG: Hsp20/alpha crystallin family protein [Actinocatenispora sp.]
MSMLRFDPFRDLDRLTSEWMNGGTRAPRWAPMDAYRSGENYLVHLDLPGIAEDSLEVTAENNTLTVRAERRSTAPKGAQFVVNERPMGAFTRQMVLGDGLDLDSVSAHYQDGVLTLMIPVAAQAKPRRIDIGRGDSEEPKVITGATG